VLKKEVTKCLGASTSVRDAVFRTLAQFDIRPNPSYELTESGCQLAYQLSKSIISANREVLTVALCDSSGALVPPEKRQER
jgi:hypothetical protein